MVAAGLPRATTHVNSVRRCATTSIVDDELDGAEAESEEVEGPKIIGGVGATAREKKRRSMNWCQILIRTLKEISIASHP